jgi:hypothetical protein
MGQKTEKKTIGELTYTTTQLPAMKALALSTRLGRAIGPALAEAAGLSGDASVSKLGPAVTALFSRLDGAEAQALTRDILAATSVEMDGKVIPLGDAAMVDHVFTGKLQDLFAVIRFSLEVNFSDFFAALASAGADALAAKAKLEAPESKASA